MPPLYTGSATCSHNQTILASIALPKHSPQQENAHQIYCTNLFHHSKCACHYDKLKWLPVRSRNYSIALSSLRQNITAPSDTKISFYPDKSSPQLWLVITTWPNNYQCTSASTVSPITSMIHLHYTITHNAVIWYGAKSFPQHVACHHDKLIWLSAGYSNYIVSNWYRYVHKHCVIITHNDLVH